jgi:hypothetical protein
MTGATANSRGPRARYALLAALFAAAVVIGAVFFTRFSLPQFLIARLVDPFVGMLLVVAASFAFGTIGIAAAKRLTSVILSREDGEGSSPEPQEKILRFAQDDSDDVPANISAQDDSGDTLLLGVPLFGLALSIVAIAGFATPIAIGTVTIVAALCGAIVGWKPLARLIAEARGARMAILLPPIALAFLGAITPVNTPDELTYKLAVPHLYLQFGRMLELPLNSDSYIPSAVYMADLAALVLSSGIAAKLVHFVLYLLALRVIHRTARDLTERHALWLTAVVAWTPALAIIAGWAWAEWAMIALVLLSFLRWQRFLDSHDTSDLAIAALALGCAISSKYTALPWAIVFITLAIRRMRSSPRALAAAAIITAIAGSFFYIRNAIWTGSPIAPFLLPDSPTIAHYRSALGGWGELIRGYDVFHPAIIDDALGIVMPVLILLSPAALLWRNRRVVDLFLLGAVQLAGLIALAPTSRLMMLALVPLALLGAFVTVQIWETASRAMRVALASVAGIALFGQLVLLAFMFVSRWSVIPYLIGTESEAAYLAHTRDFYQPYTWIETHTPGSAKLLLLAENRTYYLDRRTLAAGNLDGPRVAAWLARFPTPGAFARELHREGITHVVVHRPWYRVAPAPPPSMIEKESLLVVSPATNAMLHAFLGSSGREVYADNAYVVYALNQ